MADTPETVATRPVRVDVRSVENELAGLWRQASEGGLPGVSAAVSRTILSNLLVYASSDREADEAAETISELAANHPTRALIADAQPGEPGSELDADVSMLCNISERGRWLCGEQIRLHTHGIAETAMGTIIPVLVPDLPVYLWTPGDLPADDKILRYLVQLADHWIIDSRRFTSWTGSFRLIASLGHERKTRGMIHDLAWTSLTGWREAVAQHFDPLPARNYLPGIKQVDIACKPPKDAAPAIEAVLMASWLISRLGWQAPRVSDKEDGTWRILTRSEEGEVKINIILQGSARSFIDEITISSEQDGKTAAFHARLGDHPDEIQLQVEAPDIAGIRRTITQNQGRTCNLVCQVLDSPGQDMLYERAIPILEGLLLEIEGRK